MKSGQEARDSKLRGAYAGMDRKSVTQWAIPGTFPAIQLAIFITFSYPYCKEVRSMLAKKTAKNQLTLPKEIADQFPGVDLFDAKVERNRIVLVPVKITPITTSLESIRDKMERLGINEVDVTDAVAWARKKKR